MGMVFVLAGSYNEFWEWYKTSELGPTPKFVLHSGMLRDTDPLLVSEFIRIGTYWENPVWGSEAYIEFMEGAREDGRPWAKDWAWPEDWHRANQLKKFDPVMADELGKAQIRAVIETLDDD